MKTKAFERMTEYFADTLSEADELIQDGQLTADELINAFVTALTEQAQYFSDKAKVYDDIYFAIAQRGRNK